MASKGTSKFVLQRGSAVVLLPLLAWFLIGLIGHAGASQEEMRAWLGQPVPALLMAVLVIVGAFHMRIGLGEVIEDYIHTGLRGLLLALNWGVAIGIAALAAWSALSLAFGG